MSAGVELDHVTVKFGNFTAVNDATLDIKGGEFFSFLGPSGCGKTTISSAPCRASSIPRPGSSRSAART